MQNEDVKPQLREVKPINFLFFRAETLVQDLGDFIPVAKDLFREAVRWDLHISGPVHWHYFGFTGDDTKPFTLEVALPVDRVIPDYDGPLHFKRSESFRCVSIVHEGGWLRIPDSYGKLMTFIAAHGLKPVAANRELYINADFEDPDANVTEIQIGIQ